MKKIIAIFAFVIFFFFLFVYLEQLKEGEIGLDSSEVIRLINVERTLNNLQPLEKNELLSHAAKEKAKDLLKQQYFAHESPEGVAVGDLVDIAGYDYIFTGENLAKGDFRDETEIVEGWMNSPGHRKNILEPTFTESGMAIKSGIFEGRPVWIGVQIFATPKDICPIPDDSLERRAEEKKRELEEVSDSLDKLDYTNPRYNLLIEENNRLVESINQLVDEYNRQIQNRINCINELGIN